MASNRPVFTRSDLWHHQVYFHGLWCKDSRRRPVKCPPKFCHKCYKLALRGGTCFAINAWPPHKRYGNGIICSSYKDQQKLGRKRKPKPGVKPKHDPGSEEQIEMVEGMSGTLSFQPDPNTLSFSEEVKNLKSYRGMEPLYPEQFVENIKHEYMCPICKEVLDQPVQTKCQTPGIYFVPAAFHLPLRHVDPSAQFAELQLKILRSSLNQLLLFYKLYYQNQIFNALHAHTL